mgnify:CR=1 FL=1
MKEKKKIEIPALTQLEAELERENRKRQYRGELGKMAGILIVIGCALALVADMMLPVLQVNGTSMSPTLRKGDIVISMRGAEFTRGDMVAFYHSDKILVKRVIGLSEEWIDMNSDGDVYIDGVLLQEPYLEEKAFGECNIELPYQVPKGKVFVMGDHRSVSEDSRSSRIDCVSQAQIIGKLKFRVWPFESVGPVQ